MKSEIIFKAESGNYYLASFVEKTVFPIPPLLFHIICNVNSLNEIVFNKQEGITIDGIKYSKSEIRHYIKKWLFLNKNGCFTKEMSKKKYKGRISPEIIQKKLVNVPQIVFEVTEKCNLNCMYCALGKFYNNDTNERVKKMSYTIAKNVINFFIPLWNSPANQSINDIIAVGFYGGEPLLRIDLIRKIIGYIELNCETSKGFRWNMTTNAVLLDKYMDFLVEKQFNLLISLDGNEYHDSYRSNHNGDSSFNRVVHNIRLLRKKYPEFYESNVNFNSVLHDRNSIPEIISFFEKEFGKIPNIVGISNSNIHPDKKEEFNKIYKNYSRNLHKAENYEELVQKLDFKNPEVIQLAIFLHRYSGNFFRSYKDLMRLKEDEITFMPTGTCIPFAKKIFISARGKILPCERIGHQYALGYVKKKTINLNYSAIAKKYNQYFEKLSIQCQDCHNVLSCGECIFHIDSIDDDNPVCPNSYDSQNLARYLSNQISFLEKKPWLYKKIMKDLVIS